MEFNSKLPIYMQIINDIKVKIIRKDYVPGDKLPSLRDLAKEYKVNPNTAQRVYQGLELENLVTVERGIGTFITLDEEVIKDLKDEFIKSLVENFIYKIDKLGLNLKDVLTVMEDKYVKVGESNE